MANLGSENNNPNIDGAITSYTDFGGNDTYTILPSLFDDVTITDNQASIVNLPAGIVISAANFSARGVQFVVNDKVVTFLGNPSQFTFVFGGDPVSGGGTPKSFSETAEAFGTTVPAPDALPNAATQTGPIGANGTVGQTLTLSASSNSVDEGASVSLAVTGADSNSTLSYTITGTGVDAADVDALKGIITTDDTGSGSASISALADMATEGPETMTVALDGTTVSTNVVINDTSIAPPVTLTGSAASVDEGASVSISVFGAAANSTLSYTITGTGVDAADVDALKGTITTNASGAGSATIAAIADKATEGPETMTVTLDEVAVSADIVINDTSMTPPVTLTPGLDTVQGTGFDDLFQATVSPLPSANTLNVGDKIDGGDGNDTLIVDLRQSFTGFAFDGFLRNIETVLLGTDDEVERVFNATDIVGVETYSLSGNVEIVGLGATDIDIALQDRNVGNTRIAFDADAVSGSNDSMNVALKDLGRVGSTTQSQQIVGLDIAGIETLNVTSDGANVVAIDTQDVKSITATGPGFLELTGVGTGLKTFDGTLASGGIDVDFNEAVGMTAIRTGTGNDVIRTSENALDVAAIIDGGEGIDLLALVGPIGIAQYSIENIEVLALVGPDSQATFSSLAASEVERIIVASTNADGEYDFVNLGERTLAVTSSGNAAGTLITDNSGELSVDIETSDGTASNSDLNISALEAVRVDMRVADGARYSGDLTADVAEAVILSGAAAGTAQNRLVITADAALTADIDLAETSFLVITADAALTADIDLAETSFLELNAGRLDDLRVTAGSDLFVNSDSGIVASNVVIEANGVFDGVPDDEIDIGEVQTFLVSGVGQVKLGEITGDDIDFEATGLRDAGLDALEVDAIRGANLDIDVSNVLGSTNFKALSGETVVFQGSTLRENSVTVELAGASGGSVTFVGGIQEDKVDVVFVNNVGTNAVSSQAEVSIEGGRRKDTYSFAFNVNDGINRSAVVTIQDFTQDGSEADALEGNGLKFLSFEDIDATGGGLLGGLLGGGSPAVSAEQQAADLLIDAGITPSVAATDIEFVNVGLNLFRFDGNLYGLARGTDGAADATLDDGEILFQFIGLQEIDSMGSLSMF